MRLLQMSAQQGDALRNARFALDAPRSLAPIADRLSAAGVSPEAVQRGGHVWGFKDRTVFTSIDMPMPDDVALRIEPGALLSRLYRVLAVFPDEPSIANAVNGRPWIEDPPGAFRNSVVFEPYERVAPRPYLAAMQRFNPAFTGGFNFKGKFLDDLGPAELVLESLIGAPVNGRYATAPGDIDIASTRRPRRSRQSQTRPSTALFRAKVFHAYRDSAGIIACSACDIEDEDLLEAAHIVDEGYAADEWWNGLPLCRNHHRLFDLGRLRLHPATGHWTLSQSNGATHSLTKPNISRLVRTPSAGALRWKWESE